MPALVTRKFRVHNAKQFKESIDELDRRIKSQKGIEVIFSKIKNANHFFKNREEDLKKVIEKYIKEKTSLI